MHAFHRTTLLTLTVTCSALAFTPAPPPPGYSVEAGNFVFVMLTTECVKEQAEIVVTPPVLEALRAQYARIEKMIEAAFDEDSPTPFPYTECDRRALLGSFSVVEEVGGVVRIRIESYRERYVRDVKSSAGQDYPVPGMYRNDGSVHPLWTVDWYTGSRNLSVSPDGHHVVRRFHRKYSEEGAAIEFYRYGKMIKRYAAAELVGDNDDDGQRGFYWEPMKLDDDGGTLSTSTNHHALLVFGVQYGQFGEITTRYVGNDGKKQFSVTLLRRDGASIELSEFQMCGSPSFQSSLVTDDTPPSRYLYGMRPEHVTWLTVDDKTGAIGYEPPEGMGYFAIPFSKIRDFHPILGSKFQIALTTVAWDPRRWEVTEFDGTQHSLIIDTRNLFYCGRGPDGQIQSIGHRDTAGITFHAAH